MAETDSYEEWKAQGRPGGSFANWMASQAPPPTSAPVPPPAAATPPPTQPAAGGAASPFKDATATQEYNRMVAAGEDPTTAANIVRNALYGVQHDWQEQGGDQGTRWAGNGPLEGQTAEQAVNQFRAWEKDRMQGCPPDFPYKGRNGQCAEKPDDCPDGMHVVGTPGKCVQNGPGEEDMPKGPNSGKGGGPPPPPPKPVTFGSQLSMGTGNPLQDMLIQQFNTGQDPNTLQSNIFGLGEDFRVGGAGRSADQGGTAPTRQGQSLGGGGLWWGQDKDTFSGFDASQKNAEGAATVSPAFKAAPEPKPTAAAPTIGGPVVNSGAGQFQGGAGRARVVAPYNTGIMKPKVTPIGGMMTNAFPPSYR